LWQVDDRATAELMARFYRALREGKSKPEALRQAKLAFILRGGGTRAGQAAGGQRGVGLAPEAYRDLAHPYYWAPFVFSGVE
jgi:CHAT domain-containing protein